MSAVTFDTLKFAQTLEQAKLPREQASAIAAAVRDAQLTTDVATKADLDELEARTDSKFDLMRQEMNAKFAQVDAKFDLMRKEMDTMRKDIIIKQGAMMVTLAGLVLAGVKLL